MGEMSSEKKALLTASLAEKDDWYGTCRKCKKRLRGTQAELMEHKCGEQTSK